VSAVPAVSNRYDARLEIAFAGADSRLRTLRQAAPLRAMTPYPEPDDRPLAVLANIAGGVAGGDRLAVAIEVRDRADATVTGQAAEKIYRADGAASEMDVSVTVAAGSTVEYLPQGTILFDGARLARRTSLDVEGDGRLLFGEILHLGRTAMGERFASGSLADHLVLRHDGRPIWADALRLAGDPGRAIGATSGLGGATTTAVALLSIPDAAKHLDRVREIVGASTSDPTRAAAAVFEGGPLLVRWLSNDGADLRRHFGEVWRYLRAGALGRPGRMPRIWAI
jgi:urease accessory protein